MDIYGLAATHIHPQAQPAPMNAQAENRYYANRVGLPHLHRGLTGSLAITLGIILFLGTSLI
jgi:hypothetical protein